MTTRVPRGAGRPAATARRTKAAQQTPLPPRPGEVEAAREAIREAQAETSKAGRIHMGRRRAPETVRAERAAKAQESTGKAASSNGEAAKRSAGTRGKAKPAETTTAGRTPPVLGETKSAAKARAFCAEATKLGWSPEYRRGEGEDHIIVVATRGTEVIEIEWVRGVFLNTCVYSSAGRAPIKLRNASAAKMRMAVSPTSASEEAARVTAHKVARPRRERTEESDAPREPRRMPLPFSEASLDQEVLDALYGKRIWWLNSISGTEEEDRVPALQESAGPSTKDGTPTVRKQHHQPHITEGTNDGRIINFVGATGFRSVRLSAILRVGR